MMGIGSDTESRKIQAALLEEKYPQIKGLLREEELLLSVSERRPLRVTGLFCMGIGVVVAQQMFLFFLSTAPMWALAVLVFFALCIWVGLWLAIFIQKESVFVTDSRIVHWKVNRAGQLAKTPMTIPLAEVAGVHLYRNSILMGGRNNSGGEILVKKKDSRSYLFPSLKDSAGLSEILMAEVTACKINQAVDTTSQAEHL